MEIDNKYNNLQAQGSYRSKEGRKKGRKDGRKEGRKNRWKNNRVFLVAAREMYMQYGPQLCEFPTHKCCVILYLTL